MFKTRDDVKDATWVATEAATRDATRDATWVATQTATWDATRAATEAAIRGLINEIIKGENK